MTIKNLDAYLPMPRIWLKMVISFFVKLAAGAVFYWAFHKEIALHPNLVYFFGFLILVGIGFYWFGIVFDGRNPWSWLKEFWRRNVCGYTLDCYLDDKGAVAYGIEEPNQMFYREALFPTLFLPLGGWFHRLRPKQTCDGCPSGWSACFAGIERDQAMVKLVDRDGYAVLLTAQEALQILQEEQISGNQAGGRWSLLLHSILTERRIYRQEVDEAWHQMTGLEWRLDWTRKALLSFHQRSAAAGKRKDYR